MLVQQLTHVPAADRQAMREGPRDSATHLRHAAAIPALGQIEIGGTASRDKAGEALIVVAWNVERLRYGDAIAATLAAQSPRRGAFVRGRQRHGALRQWPSIADAG